MSKPKKPSPADQPKRGKRQSKYDITVKLDMTFEEAIKKAVNTPPIKRKDIGKK